MVDGFFCQLMTIFNIFMVSSSESECVDLQEYMWLCMNREEHMPMPTAEQARIMLNERLCAFAENKEKCGQIEPEFSQQVYRTIGARKVFTFRQFIKECLRRFEIGDFAILYLQSCYNFSFHSQRDIARYQAEIRT